MDSEQRAKILNGLTHIRKRPGMYFSPEAPAVANFIEGFRIACAVLGSIAEYDAVYKQVIIEHGWEWSSTALWIQMKARGLDDEAMIAELLDIQTAIWERIPLSQPMPLDNHS
jgi:hypothetical protein